MKMGSKDRIRTDYLIQCGVKKSWHSKTLSEYKNDTNAKAIVTKYLKNASENYKNGVGLYLYGANGTGKSHLMNTSFIDLLDKRYSIRVFSLDEIVDTFTNSWYSDEAKANLNKILKEVNFLGIDEFGKNIDASGNPVYLPDLVKRVMETVIRFRVQMKKPIWFTSNTEPTHVAKVFSEDIASLLREAVVPVCVKGDDFRRTIQRENINRMK